MTRALAFEQALLGLASWHRFSMFPDGFKQTPRANTTWQLGTSIAAVNMVCFSLDSLYTNKLSNPLVLTAIGAYAKAKASFLPRLLIETD